MPAGLAEAFVYGVQLGLRYSPIFAVVGSAAAAVVYVARVKVAEARVWAGSILVVAWLLGDGMRIIARARDAYDGQLALSTLGDVSPEVVSAALLVWALFGLGVGYLLPMATGVYVGRRVTHGTGWLTAGSIAVAASLAVSALTAFVIR